MKQNINLFLEKNVPTDPSKWQYYVSQAKKKFDVYPSAYANGWAAKKYKAAGGSWKTEGEEPERVAQYLPQTKELRGKLIGEKLLQYFSEIGLKHACFQNEGGEIKVVGLNKEQVKEAINKVVENYKKIKESEDLNEEILKPGTKVKVQHRGKTVSGKIVRYDGRTPGSPFYIVYTGQYDSIEVPAHEVIKESEDLNDRIKQIKKESSEGEKIQNLNNRIKKLRDKINSVKSKEAKIQIQKRLVNALQRLSDKKKGLGIKSPHREMVGLNLPNGYINGAPSPEDVKKMRIKLDAERINQKEALTSSDTEPDVITALRDIVKNQQNKPVLDPKSGRKMRVDVLSARAVTLVYDALKSNINKSKFVNSGLPQMVSTAFKLTKFK